MTGQDLKNSILQLAIQGKLVAQDANDEPASVLLERIKAEKKKLIEEKKIKKEKPLAEITEDEKPFEIPDSWVWCRLGEIGDWGSGATPSKGKPDYYDKGYIPWIRTGELNNSIVYDSEIKITDKALKECSLRICKTGDVLIAMYGATIGKVAILNIPATTNQACCACTPIFIFNWYLLYFLMANKKAFTEMSEGGAQPNISKEKILRTSFPLPPLSEQKRIVTKIEELMPLVDEYDKAQKELNALNSAMPEQLKQSILQEAIMGKLGTNNPDDEPASELLKRIRKEKEQLIKDKKIKKEKPLPEITDEEKPFDIPDNWVWCRWGDLSFSIQYGYNASAQQNGDIRMVRISDIQNNEVLWDSVPYCKIKAEEIEGYLLKPNDILFARTGGTVGKSFLVKKVPYPSIYAGYLIRTRYSNNLVPQYLKYFMESRLYWEQLREGTIATAQPNCNGKTLGNMRIPLPPLAEQHRIVSKIENLFACIEPLAKDLK